MLYDISPCKAKYVAVTKIEDVFQTFKTSFVAATNCWQPPTNISSYDFWPKVVSTLSQRSVFCDACVPVYDCDSRQECSASLIAGRRTIIQALMC